MFDRKRQPSDRACFARRVAAALADSAHVHVGGERHLIWRCLENGGYG
jgi:hypothetical protein